MNTKQWFYPLLFLAISGCTGLDTYDPYATTYPNTYPTPGGYNSGSVMPTYDPYYNQTNGNVIPGTNNGYYNPSTANSNYERQQQQRALAAEQRARDAEQRANEAQLKTESANRELEIRQRQVEERRRAAQQRDTGNRDPSRRERAEPVARPVESNSGGSSSVRSPSNRERRDDSDTNRNTSQPSRGDSNSNSSTNSSTPPSSNRNSGNRESAW